MSVPRALGPENLMPSGRSLRTLMYQTSQHEAIARQTLGLSAPAAAGSTASSGGQASEFVAQGPLRRRAPQCARRRRDRGSLAPRPPPATPLPCASSTIRGASKSKIPLRPARSGPVGFSRVAPTLPDRNQRMERSTSIFEARRDVNDPPNPRRRDPSHEHITFCFNDF